ncbi:MAG: hypothetical protein C4293_07265, partial [Nitrospiraceae bacterium]
MKADPKSRPWAACRSGRRVTDDIRNQQPGEHRLGGGFRVRFFKAPFIVLLIIGATAALFVWSGIYNIAAAKPHAE